jgi:hypothetical protein
MSEKFPLNLQDINNKMAALELSIGLLQEQIAPLQKSLSKLRKKRASIENGKMHLPKLERDEIIRRAFARLFHHEYSYDNNRACEKLGLITEKENYYKVKLLKKNVIEMIVVSTGLTKKRIREILRKAV